MSAASTAHAPTRTVMILDDDHPLRRAAERVLSRAGYRVLSASTSREANAVAAQETGEIDLLVCDLVLPDLSGREAANLLMARRPEMKVLFTSGFSSHGSFRRELEHAGFLPKPFGVPDLLAAVATALGDDEGDAGGTRVAAGGEGA